ncbi:NAD(P)/FAD-dependent oxidoreductase [Hyphococcus luteus]|uniref:Sulfide-quinone reductase n=1 Tax=Hyphococcus luteus TaxID=2058213 RepID=A0A2S7KAI4_9PROT|nr:FAD-dependent oxidoreductase [Marinicaulis flavus]PQA89526.1 pyridine nucleotide-disulfide oxidoreductase [Marinicaulis flavus]
MAHIVVLGGGLGGVIMAYEARAAARKEDKVTVISDKPTFDFTPSNPWVGVGWREPDQIKVELEKPLAKKNIDFIPVAAAKVRPEENAVELTDGRKVVYDYLVIATGPELAFDEIEGLGPHGGHTQSICTTPHSKLAHDAFEAFVKNPGPIVVGAVQGASCFGPAYEYAFILDRELRKRKIRDKVPMTFVTSEPYIGHLGLDGVGDTKTLLESQLREQHIKWITNAKIKKVDADKVFVEEVDESGAHKADHELAADYSMLLPAFRGIEAVRDVEGLVNPRGFIIVDKHQRNPTFKNIFSVGVCVAIPPIGPTAVPVGVPKTGFMIESMTAATAENIGKLLRGEEPASEATWNAMCLADFGDGGVAFVAMPQIPPRNVNWAADGKWVHLAKVAFERYFLGKVRSGNTEPYYEKAVLKLLGLEKLKA